MARLLQATGIALLSLAFAGACGDDEATPDAGQGVIDAPLQPADADVDGSPDADTSPDANQCPAPAVGEPGGACQVDTDCDSSVGAGDGLCFRGTVGGESSLRWPPEGYCSRGCVEDADCGDGATCQLGGLCLPECCAGDVCSPGQLCDDNFFGDSFTVNSCLPGNPNAVDGSACAGFYECNASSNCLVNQHENVSGYCYTVGCTIGDDTTCAQNAAGDGDGHCVDVADTTFDFAGATVCVDACAVDADCNEAEQYECFDGGAAGMYCRHPEAGDACAADGDCGAVPPWTCMTDAEFTGGYCTVLGCNADTGAGCSAGSSVCYDPDGTPETQDGNEYCAERCDPEVANTCRTGYVCTQVRTSNEGNPIGGCLPE